jgi:hypothetical protein
LALAYGPQNEPERRYVKSFMGHHTSRLLKNLVVSWSGWDSEGLRKDKDESPGVVRREIGKEQR